MRPRFSRNVIATTAVVCLVAFYPTTSYHCNKKVDMLLLNSLAPPSTVHSTVMFFPAEIRDATLFLLLFRHMYRHFLPDAESQASIYMIGKLKEKGHVQW